MNYVLFLMFLIAPPGKKEPDWALQNTNSMEFATYSACERAAKEIAKSIKKTPTIYLAAWCLRKDDPQAVARRPEASPGSPTDESAPSARSSAPSPRGAAPVPPSAEPPARLKLD